MKESDPILPYLLPTTPHIPKLHMGLDSYADLSSYRETPETRWLPRSAKRSTFFTCVSATGDMEARFFFFFFSFAGNETVVPLAWLGFSLLYSRGLGTDMSHGRCSITAGYA
ncbi:hypothetical protein P167DRAFT_163653 [Morchella conica CCBAS932]|uniref:Uncharacterized protein n=1 Tax=Morchella conica CCBAS932 TaxID=1392247 RepID=A0A3N4KPH1_9PEZI|nr:hypothetical protein P167DRAFT_163653 [Morchella conica CCBAS932]